MLHRNNPEATGGGKRSPLVGRPARALWLQSPPFLSRTDRMIGTIGERYRTLSARGEIERDAGQERAVAALAGLEARLARYRPHAPWIGPVFARASRAG